MTASRTSLRPNLRLLTTSLLISAAAGVVAAPSAGAAELYGPAAPYDLARRLELGQGVDRDLAKAVELYRQADADGDLRGTEVLGDLYLEGQGVDRDPAKALEYAQKAAEAGFADSENRVGYIHGEGVGVPRDWKLALDWFEKAAAQGHKLAIKNVDEVKAEIACSEAAASPYEADFAAVGRELSAIDPGVAIDACQKAVDLDPGSDEDKAWLARALIANGRYDEARPLLETAVAGDSLLARQLLGDDLHGDFGGSVDDARALEVLAPAAEAGFAPAQLSYGWAFQEGLGTDIDEATAAEWYRKAADQGLPRAMANLGYLYHGGIGVDLDYAEAMRWYTAAAEKDDVVGIYGVGQLYEYGQGVEQDYAKAYDYFVRAADMGDAFAQNDLGYLYDTGLGVDEDPAMAAKYYQMAVDQDYALAKANLALLLNAGRGVEADPQRAFQLNQEAHDAGEPEGTVGLADAYLDGKVVAYDPSEARYYAEIASESGDNYSQNLYGYLLAEGLGGVRDWYAALDQFQKSADQGNETAATNLAETKAEIACSEAAASPYEAGFESTGKALEDIDPDVAIPACQEAVDKDSASVEDKAWLARALIRAGRTEEAVPLLEPSVDARFAPGMTLFADLLQRGDGVDRDPARGFQMFKDAAAAGFAPAELGIARSWELGLGVAPDKTIAAKWYKKAAADGVAEATQLLLAMDQPKKAEPLSGPGRAEAKL